jgi:hypothetical protein
VLEIKPDFERRSSFVDKGEHLELVRCHYNFVRPHSALRFGRETRAPAMQAGLARRRLTLREVFVCTLASLIKEDRGEDVRGTADAERPRHGTAFGRVNNI